MLNPAVLQLALGQCWRLVFHLAKKRLQWHAVILCMASGCTPHRQPGFATPKSEHCGCRIDGSMHACRVNSAKRLRHLFEQIDTDSDGKFDASDFRFFLHKSSMRLEKMTQVSRTPYCLEFNEHQCAPLLNLAKQMCNATDAKLLLPSAYSYSAQLLRTHSHELSLHRSKVHLGQALIFLE